MTIIIKKATKRVLFSIATVSGLLFALVLKFFLGGSAMNLSQLESKAKNSLGKVNAGIPTARADVPPGCDVGTCSSGDGMGCDY